MCSPTCLTPTRATHRKRLITERGGAVYPPPLQRIEARLVEGANRGVEAFRVERAGFHSGRRLLLEVHRSSSTIPNRIGMGNSSRSTLR